MTLEPGQTVRVAELAGPRAITALKVKMAFADRQDQMTGLRKTALQITWDGQAKPAVWCPLGDFFGTAPGENLYKSLTDGHDQGRLLRLLVHAVCQAARPSSWSTRTKCREALRSRSFTRRCPGRSRAWATSTPSGTATRSRCRRTAGPTGSCSARRAGGGSAASCCTCGIRAAAGGAKATKSSSSTARSSPPPSAPARRTISATPGAIPALFQRPYHGQTMTQNNQGHQSVLRWHIVDNVPFQESFEGCIEKYDHPGPTVQYACTACWYLSPDGTTRTSQCRRPSGTATTPMPPLVGRRVRGVGQVAGKSRPKTWSALRGGKMAQQRSTMVDGARPGAKLNLRLPVKSAGQQRLDLGLTKARDYAIVQFYLDGKRLGEPIDLYHAPDVIPTTRSLGVHELTAGRPHTHRRDRRRQPKRRSRATCSDWTRCLRARRTSAPSRQTPRDRQVETRQQFFAVKSIRGGKEEGLRPVGIDGHRSRFGINHPYRGAAELAPLLSL